MIDCDSDTNQIVLGDCAEILPLLENDSFALIYIDPPFNTGSRRKHTAQSAVRDEHGSRTGFGGQRYTMQQQESMSYDDSYENYVEWLKPLMRQARRLLTSRGTLYFHIDYRESHYCKVMLDGIFGRECFLNEIIWAYDFGGRSKRRWPAKHDTILVYVKDPDAYYFDQESVNRIPYMAPGLVTPEKAARGKLPTDVWWHTIVGTNSRERTGYPTQKPEGVLRRIISASSAPGDRVLDFFAGSGTTGAVAHELGRRFMLIDSNPEAVHVMEQRLGHCATQTEFSPR